ncbi:MAG: Natural resistance-associated macrophage protein [Candidatus Magasanikbacteria bacterium GW2011_GWA2_46_17]|uniref:Natural resistance-associated macrophage protein n=1 Tax=Candidatus Magasanikbacteria bacterium GW2011_GWA2_46_17 TaxID=1619042 RepID=A0A0G1P3L9_9BACT|nr:MAG: Natural resistance-associated macrophage protein [Candidatus Magasanikbacteria bacterium GW2011_GWA2_46_17]
MVKRLRRLWVWFFFVGSAIGPGIIAGTANNDAGGISTYSFAGSKFGYLLLWVLTANLITLACTQEIGVRLGAFTGKGLAALIRERFGVRWTMFALGILLLANTAVAISEFAGVAAALEIFHISKYFSIPILAIIVWVFLYKGSFKKIERFFLTISLFFLVYLASAWMSRPDWSMVIQAAGTPYLSLEPGYFLALLGIMGTTITPWGQFFIQSYVVDKGMGSKHFRVERWEVYFSALFTCIIAAAIIITTKGVLFDRGIVVDNAEKAALSLTPVLGVFAQDIFAAGFFFASLLGAFILPLTTSYSICEALGFEHGINTKWKQAPWFYGIITFVVVSSAIFVLLPFISLFKTMIFAQVLNGILLPIILVFLVLLFHDRARLGLPPVSRLGSAIYGFITWEAIIRLTLISFLLVIIILFPSLLDIIRAWLIR